MRTLNCALMTILVLAPALIMGCGEEPGNIALGFKGGARWTKDPLTGHRAVDPQWQIDAVGPRWWNDRLAVTGSIALPALFEVRNTSNSQVGDVATVEDFRDKFESWDLRLGVLYWPWQTTGIKPYVGAGIGYWNFHRTTTTRLTTAQGTTHNVTETASGETGDTFFPWVTTGIEVPVIESVAAVGGVEYGWGKDYRGNDLADLMVMIGLRWQF